MGGKGGGRKKGAFCFGGPATNVVINELLAHSHAGDPDWIELYNATDASVDIGGWVLRDSNSDPKK